MGEVPRKYISHFQPSRKKEIMLNEFWNKPEIIFIWMNIVMIKTYYNTFLLPQCFFIIITINYSWKYDNWLRLHSCTSPHHITDQCNKRKKENRLKRKQGPSQSKREGHGWNRWVWVLAEKNQRWKSTEVSGKGSISRHEVENVGRPEIEWIW